MDNKDLTNLGNELNHIINLDKIDDDSIIVDAGANVGLFIESMRNYTNAKIYAIECSPTCCAHIEDAAHSNIELIQKALVGELKGSVTFTEIEGPPTGDGYKKYHQWGNIFGYHSTRFTTDTPVQVNQYEVETVTLNNLLEQYKWRQIDYLKMDVEGSEYEIIESLKASEATSIRQISLETHIPAKNSVLISQLKSLGYKTELFAFDEVYAWRED
jgi:FkbM family methyltransferase